MCISFVLSQLSDNLQAILIKQILKMTHFRMTSSTYQSPSTYRPAINLAGIQQRFNKYGIKLQKMGDAQLQTAYSMCGYKASGQKPNQMCFIFISTIQQDSLSVSSYRNGTLLQKKDFNNIDNLPQFIKSSWQLVGQDGQQISIQKSYQNTEKMFEELNKHSEKILKNAQNQMMAVQQIKSSQQYINICSHAKSLTLEIQQMCNTVKARKNKVQMRNQGLIKTMLQVEAQKELLQQSLYKYSQLIKQISDVQSILSKIITNRKSNVQCDDFFDEESFNLYLEQALNIKILENQKKYLNNS